ncbi:hypothetical protein Tco_0169475 [Tanacetum coccineum]
MLLRRSKSDYLTKPILNHQYIDEFNLNDETSLSEYDEENVSRFNDLFNIIHPDDSKSEKENDDNDIDIEQSLEGNKITHGSNGLLNKMSDTEMGLDVADTLLGLELLDGCDRLIHNKGDLRDYWIEISSDRDFLGPAPSYVLIQDPVRRLCHMMITYSISGRGQAPEKIPMHAEGRKSGARLSGGAVMAGAHEPMMPVRQLRRALLVDSTPERHLPLPLPTSLGPDFCLRIERSREEMHDLRHEVKVCEELDERLLSSLESPHG